MTEEHWNEILESYVMNGEPAHDIKVLRQRMEGCLVRNQIDTTEIQRWINAILLIQMDMRQASKSVPTSEKRAHGFWSRRSRRGKWASA